VKNEKNIRLDLVLALAANWRSEGKYGCNTPEDARSQRCADQLLQVFGLPLNAHTKAGEDYKVLLQAHGIVAHSVEGQGTPNGGGANPRKIRYKEPTEK